MAGLSPPTATHPFRFYTAMNSVLCWLKAKLGSGSKIVVIAFLAFLKKILISDLSQGGSDIEGPSSEDSEEAPIASLSKPDSKLAPVQDLLECTICLEVPASPIHICSNGHIICGICSDKVKKCGICESEPLQISILAERLSRQLEFKSKCPNYEAGCRNLVASTEIKEHIPKCYYRNVMCKELQGEVCKDVSIPFKDFPKHLQERHNYRMGAGSRWAWTSIVSLEGASWPMELTTKDDKFFLLHSYVGRDSVYFWMTVLADKEEAEKHMYKLTLQKELNGKKMKCSWTLPLLPYHDYPKFKGPSPLFVTIPQTVLCEFCGDEVEVEEEEEMRIFFMSHRVL